MHQYTHFKWTQFKTCTNVIFWYDTQNLCSTNVEYLTMKVHNKSKLTKGDIQYLCFKYMQSLFNVTPNKDGFAL